MNENNKRLVLVVDDKPENLNLMRSILATNHYRVELAPDGVSALQIARTMQPDLILLDVRMPGMDGYEVCQHLKEDEVTRNIPVIFVTAMNDAEAETRCLEVGGADYIAKPFNLSVALARIRTHLAISSQRMMLGQMFRDVIEFTSEALLLANAEGVIVQINENAEKLFGYSRQEIVGMPVASLIPPSLAGIAAGQTRDHGTGASLLCLRKDGSEFLADVNFGSLQTNRGLLSMMGVRDATERKNAAEELKVLRQQVQDMQNVLKQGRPS